MRIIYVHQYFKTPKEGGAIRSWHLAHALTEEGHTVEVITAHNKESGVRTFGKLKVHYINVPYDNTFSFFKRIKAFLVFFYKAYKLIGKSEKPDLIYATSTPLTIGVLALLIKKVKGIKFFFEVRDLWPKVPDEMGFIKNSFIKVFAYFLEEKIYKNADRIIVLSPPMKKYVVEKLGKDSFVECIPNFSDCDFFQPIEKEPGDKFIIGYFGTVGLANNIIKLAEAADFLKSKGKENVLFKIAASGSELRTIKDYAMKRKLGNIQFFDPVDKNGVRALMQTCDASYISYANYPSLWTGSPNKFFDSIASGKLIILNFGGWIKESVEEAQCGFYYEPDYPEQLLSKLDVYIRQPDLLKVAKVNARNLAEQNFSKSLMLERFLNLFTNNGK